MFILKFFLTILLVTSIYADAKQKEYFIDIDNVDADFLYGVVFENDKFLLQNKSLCTNLLTGEKDYVNGKISYQNIEQVSNVEKEVLLSFDFDTGNYVCGYKIETLEEYIPVNANIRNYNNKILKASNEVENDFENPYSLFGKVYNTANINRLELKEFDTKMEVDITYSIRTEAKKLGLWTDDGTDFKKQNVTLSQFVMNLITLNADYVTGVAANGDIILNHNVISQLTILNAVENQNLKNPISTVTEAILTALGVKADILTNDKAIMKKFGDFSYEDYFDKKLFGLYYNFMNIAWGNIFSYASMLFIAFLSLYAAGGVGFKYAIHALDGDQNKGKFDFPIKARLISIAMTMVLSFLPFPVGVGSANPTTAVDGVVAPDTIYAKTTMAKETISFMANIGTSVADFATGNIVTIFMEYLLKASNQGSLKDAKASSSIIKQELYLLKLRTAFFQEHCLVPYFVPYKTFGSFQSILSDEPSNVAWETIDSGWQTGSSKTLFQDGKGRTSLALCGELERDLVIKNKFIKLMSRELDKNLARLSSYYDNNATANAISTSNLFTMSQLIATKNMGWFNIASVPVIDIFMKNTGMINVLEQKPTDGTNWDSPITMATMSATQNNAVKDDKQAGLVEDAKDQYTENVMQMHGLADGMRWMFSKSVYFMLPAFPELFKVSKSLVSDSLEVVVNSLLRGVVGEVAKKALSKLRSASQEGKKNADGITVIQGAIAVTLGFLLAVILYSTLIKVIFASIVTLFIVIKIVFYIIDVFIYYFVSPFIVGWQMTINNNSDKLHSYISNGFVLLVIRPSLIVFSTMLFIVGLGLLESLYSLIFDIVYSNVSIANNLFSDNSVGLLGGVDGVGGGMTGFLILSNIQGFGEIAIDLISLVLAYKLIMDGDKLILDKFGFQNEGESGISSQVSEKLQNTLGKV